MKKILILALLMFSYSFTSYSKVIIISDIDDTLKEANSMGKIGGIYHFLKKLPYEQMRDLFQEMNNHYLIEGEVVKFFYVSAAPSFTFNAQKWLSKNHFPEGVSYLRTKNETTYNYKHAIIEKILKLAMNSDPHLKVLMFGDNAQVDQIVYNNLKKELSLDAEIYIRDVRCEATYFSNDLPVVQLSNINYYLSEIELFKKFDYLSSDLIERTRVDYEEKNLIPHYTFLTLKKRLESQCRKLDIRCIENEKKKALEYWNDYYTRF